MRIIQIHNKYIYEGGEDAVVKNENILLKKNNHEVFQLIKNNKHEITNKFEMIKTGINLNYSKKSNQIVLNYLRNIKPDIVHIHNTFPLWTFSIIDACNEINIPIVMTLHNYRLICAKGTFYRKNKICEICSKSSSFNAVKYKCYQQSIIKSFAVSLMIRKYNKGLSLINKINKFIVLTEFSKKKFLDNKFPSNKIAVKPNFIINKYDKFIATNKKGFIFASRLTEEKGIIDLIKVHKKIDFELTVCGDGPLKKYLTNQHSINYLGHLDKDKLYDIIGKSKFLIFPSKWYEGFPIILLEAFALETVVIAPNLGSMSSIVDNKFNGLLYDPNNIEDLINKIKWALSNEEKCNQIKNNAKKEFNEKYTEEVNYNILKKIYEDAIEENKNNKLLN